MNRVSNISINDFKVYDTGSIVTHENMPILIEIEDLSIKFLFNTDETKEGLPINLQLRENKTMEITLTNFNSVCCGVDHPLKIGHLKDSSLFVQFMVSSLDATGTKVLHYTFMLKDE